MTRNATRTETKHAAQFALMSAMQVAFARDDMTEAEYEEASRQMARVERLFGYEPYSWARSC